MAYVTIGALKRLGVPTTASPVGSSSTRFQLGATASQNMYGAFIETTATTGDTRLANYRLYFSGAGGSGEVVRAYGIVNNVTAATGGTVNGGHFTLQVNGASGTVSGAANAIRATFAQGASNATGGTCAVIQVDSDLDNTATVPATLSYMRFTNSNTKKIDNLFHFTSPSTTLYAAAGTSGGSAGDAAHCAAQKVLKCLVDGVAVYIPVFTQNS